MWRGLLIQNGLDIEMYPWWTEEEKALEQTLFIRADEDYETRKSELLLHLQALRNASPEFIKIYFGEIGIAPDTVLEDWLKPSLLI